MPPDLATAATAQLDDLISRCDATLKTSRTLDLSDLNAVTVSELITAGTAAIRRLSGPKSSYAIQADQFLAAITLYRNGRVMRNIAGVLKALRHDIAAGYLTTFQELIHADVFADFLEMAEYLLAEGYKDPAAVMIGGVLEEHLRKLCIKNSLPTEFTDRSGDTRPKKADTLNADLATADVYNKLEQKQITAWLDLRNKAAHAQYTEYDIAQVRSMLQSVRDFLLRHPS